MKVPTPDFDLLRIFEALRPKDYRVIIIAPDGSPTDRIAWYVFCPVWSSRGSPIDTAKHD